ncbi:hypothetical protein H8D85_02575 [bacterium]|nr:hypothetical protein [bacterium]
MSNYLKIPMLQTGLDLTGGGLKSSVTTDVSGGGTGTFAGLTVANGDLTIADSNGDAKNLEQPCTLTIVVGSGGINAGGGSASATIAGMGFAVGDTITIAKASIGTPSADAVITITAADLQSASVPEYRYIPVEDILYVVPLTTTTIKLWMKDGASAGMGSASLITFSNAADSVDALAAFASDSVMQAIQAENSIPTARFGGGTYPVKPITIVMA